MGEPKIEKIERFFTLEEAAIFLGMTPRMLADRARARLVPSYRPGKNMIFDPRELREYAKRHKLK